MTMPVTARGGAAVPFASLNEGEGDSLSTLLSRGDGCPLPGGCGGGWSLEEEVHNIILSQSMFKANKT